MRIAFFNDVVLTGGGELWVLGACRHLAALGHQVTVVCPWRSELYHRCLAEGVDVFSYLRMSGIPIYELLFHALRRREIDVLYCTIIGTFCEATVLGTLVDRLNQERRRRPVALVLKTGLPPMRGLTPAHYGVGAGRSIPRLHVVSEQTRQAFLRWAPELERDVRRGGRWKASTSRASRRRLRLEPPLARQWGITDGEAVVDQRRPAQLDEGPRQPAPRCARACSNVTPTPDFSSPAKATSDSG